MVKYSVEILADARRDIKEHIRFLANASIPASKKLGKAFNSVIRTLSTDPFSFQIFFENYRKIIFYKRYAAFYEIVGNEVYIASVYDMRMGKYNDIVNELE